MKKFLLCAALCFTAVLHGALSSTRFYHSYLVKVTNNSSKAYTLYCSNKDWNVVLYSSISQLDLFTKKLDKPLSQLQEEYDALSQKKNDRVNDLKVNQKTDAQIAQDQEVKRLTAHMKKLRKKLRPIIKPRSVVTHLPCRIFGPDDQPNNAPKNWRWPQTALKNAIAIEVIDTNKQNGCARERISITAKSAKHSTSLCVDASLYYPKIHLIIEENGTFKLEQLKEETPQ